MYSKKMKNYTGFERTNGEMSFDEACTAYFNWKDAVGESAQEYSERIRKLKLLTILKSIIENELTKKQKNMLILKYIEGKSGEEIGILYSVTRSTVSRELMKITRIIEERMKYVFEYADTDLRTTVFPLYIEKAVALMADDASKSRTAGERTKIVREKKLLTTSEVSEGTGVPKEKIENFESGGSIGLNEFTRLILFYKMSADDAIFGV